MIDTVIKILVISLFSLLLLAACGDSDSTTDCMGEESCVCYPNGSCNGDLECRNGICLQPPVDGDVTPMDGDEDTGDDSVEDTDKTDAPQETEPDTADGDDEPQIFCQTGSENCPCYPNHTCDEGLTCSDWVCVTAPDGDTDDVDDTDTQQETEPEVDDEADADDENVAEQEEESADDVIPPVLCGQSSDCQSGQASGYLCVEGICAPCTVDAQCMQDHYYGAWAVCSPRGRCVLTQSCVDAGCAEGMICDEVTGACRVPVTCSDLDCAWQQLCEQAAADQDAQCLPQCEDGYAWNPIWGICEEYKPNCRKDAQASILEDCNAALRECIQTDEDAYCGACLPGRHEVDGVCVPVLTCGDLDCAAQNRICIPETSSADAWCGECRGGYAERFGECVEVPSPVCDPPPATGSIFSQCRTLNRECDDSSGSAACGGCLDGYAENTATGGCDVIVSCDQLQCENVFRDCEETPNGHCTDCLAPFVENSLTGECECPDGMLLDEDAATCEIIRTCTDIQAGCDAAGEFCIEETVTSHAYCSKCGYGQTWYGHLETCIPCAPCIRPGETGRIWPYASQQGHCVCETLPGYYHTESGTGGTRLCDADSDGWVVASARSPLEMDEGTAERDNARCGLRYIDRVTLINEDGGVKEVSLEEFDFLTGAVPLYEPINRDRAEVLEVDADYSHPRMKNYAPAFGRGLKPAELNPMTKICPRQNEARNAQFADYNANDVPDIDELGLQSEDADPERRLFSVFSYFVELHKGWYEHPEGEPYGRWIIREKVRSTAPSDTWAVSPGYPARAGSDYWRVCKRFRDTGYSHDGAPYNYDFARWSEPTQCDINNPESWCGMNHHSQFKCMMVEASTDQEMPHHISTGDLESGYYANHCSIEEESFGPALELSANPHDPKIRCMQYDASEGDIVWASAKFEDYQDTFDDPADPDSNYGKTYIRGCINECAESAMLPPDRQCDGPQGITCNGLPQEFGRLTCLLPMAFARVPVMGENLQNGVYYLGSPEDEPGRGGYEQHVMIEFEYGMDFDMSVYETTQDMFEGTMGYNPSRFSCGNSVCPVEQVNWYEALAFANKRSYIEGLNPCYVLSDFICADGTTERGEYPWEGIMTADYCKDHGGITHIDSIELATEREHNQCEGYRLPVEIEWELAARGGISTAFYSGPITNTGCQDDPALMSIGHYCGNAEDGTAAIAELLPNAFGLYDMSGNVAEWTADGMNDWVDYENEGIYYGMDGNASCFEYCYQPLEADVRSIRGGGWNRPAAECRSASRHYAHPGEKNYAVGFRLVRTVFGIPSERYLHVHTPMNWQAAAQHCRNIAPAGTTGHLMTVDNWDEREMLWRFFVPPPSWQREDLQRVWLGYDDNDTERQFDIDGTSAYLYKYPNDSYSWYRSDTSSRNPDYWDSGEPVNDITKNCVESTLGEPDWYAIACDSQREFICEFEAAN